MDIQVYTLNNQVFFSAQFSLVTVIPSSLMASTWKAHLRLRDGTLVVDRSWRAGCGGWKKFRLDVPDKGSGRCPDEWWWFSVDGSEILVYPIIYSGLCIPAGWPWDFWTIHCIFWFISPRVTISFGFISSSSKWKIYRLPLFSEGPVSCILYHLILWTSSTLMMVLQLRIEVAEDTKSSPKVSCT